MASEGWHACDLAAATRDAAGRTGWRNFGTTAKPRRTLLTVARARADVARLVMVKRAALSRAAAARARDPRPVRDPVRLGLARVLDGAPGFCCCAAGATASPSPDRVAPGPPLPSDARTAIVMPICNEPSSACSPGCARPTTRSSAPARSTHFDFFVLSDTQRSRHAGVPRRQAWCDWCRERRTASAASSTAAPAPHQAQERQHRRLLPALGPPLPLHGRARRRQRDERRRAW